MNEEKEEQGSIPQALPGKLICSKFPVVCCCCRCCCRNESVKPGSSVPPRKREHVHAARAMFHSAVSSFSRHLGRHFPPSLLATGHLDACARVAPGRRTVPAHWPAGRASRALAPGQRHSFCCSLHTLIRFFLCSAVAGKVQADISSVGRLRRPRRGRKHTGITREWLASFSLLLI